MIIHRLNARRFLTSAAVMLAVATSAIAQEKKHESPHWGYEGSGGPANWGKLDEAYRACGEGSVQSPIDIKDSGAVDADLPDLTAAYKPFAPAIINNGHTVQVGAPEGSGFSVEHHQYKLAQFHFHTPSEYHINGKAYPLELHLVHQRDDGALGVISVMFEEGKANPELQKIWANITGKVGETVKKDDIAVDVNGLLPDDHRYYRLMGSLTTPPCSEGVNWYVMEAPMAASKVQIEAFAKLFPEGDARPLQTSNNRLVIKDSH